MVQRVTCTPHVIEGNSQQLCFHDRNGDGTFQIGQDFVSTNPRATAANAQATTALNTLIGEGNFRISPFVRFLRYFDRANPLRQRVQREPESLEMGRRYAELYVETFSAVDQCIAALVIRGGAFDVCSSLEDESLTYPRFLKQMILHPPEGLAGSIRARHAYHALLHTPSEPGLLNSPSDRLRYITEEDTFRNISLASLEGNIRARLEWLLRQDPSTQTDSRILASQLAELQVNIEEALNFVPVTDCQALRTRCEAQVSALRTREIELRYEALYRRGRSGRVTENGNDQEEVLALAEIVNELSRDFEHDLLQYPEAQREEFRARHTMMLRAIALRGCEAALLHYRGNYQVEDFTINLPIYFFAMARLSPQDPAYTEFYRRVYE